MSLVGNLEDLSLPDILQIVSLSRKSGILTVEQEGLQGKIFIREGRVLQTVSPRPGKTLGEILTGRGLIRPEDLKKALEVQRAGNNSELLGVILIRLKLIEQAALEKIVQEQIEEAIVYFLTWKGGTFNFELADIKSRGEISIDPQDFILEKGIDTQWLVMEGTRLMDERSRRGGREKEVMPAAVMETEAGAGEQPEFLETVVVVDDDPVFREILKERLGRQRYRAVTCDTVKEGLDTVGELSRSAPPPVVITDIVLPTSDGRGFLGGLELVQKLRRSHPDVPIFAITAYPDEKVKSSVLESGAQQFILKPDAAEGEGEEAQKIFFEKLTRALAELQGAQGAGGTQEAATRSEREKLLNALSEKKAALARQEETITAAGLDRGAITLLRDMLGELRQPRATSEIGLLILRFAAELLNRAVLFVIKGGQAAGLGGFGVEVSGENRGAGGVRGITIPLDQPSLLEEVVRLKAAFRGPVVHTAWNRHLMERFGGRTPSEAIAFPLLSGGKVRVILYGDNLPEDRPLPDLQALEIFLVQAGLTLERVLLEKKLQEIESRAEGDTIGKEDVRGESQ